MWDGKKDMSGKPDPDWGGIVGLDQGHAQITVMQNVEMWEDNQGILA
jgi:hypothetical protein